MHAHLYRSQYTTKPVRSLHVCCTSVTNLIIGDEWTDCFTIHDISLPPVPFVGFTAMTGEVSDAHEYVLHLPISHIVLRIYHITQTAL